MEIAFLVTVIGAGVTMTAAHYTLPRALRRRELHPVLRFTVGVGLGILLWLWLLTLMRGKDCLTLRDMFWVCVGAGAGTVLAYGLDDWGSKRGWPRLVLKWTGRDDG